MDWISCVQNQKNNAKLGWQLEGWSSSNRDGEGCGGVGLKAVILAVSLDR